MVTLGVLAVMFWIMMAIGATIADHKIVGPRSRVIARERRERNLA